MHLEICWGQVEKSDALGRLVDEQVDHALRHCKERFTRVDVHLHDDNQDKGGSHDKRCVIEARPRGADPLAIEATGDDFFKTVVAAAKKLEHAAEHFVDRRRNH